LRPSPTQNAVLVVGLCSIVKGDAEPDADPDALPQLYGTALQSMMPASTLPAQMGGGMAEIMSMPSGGLNCGIMDQCCSMSDNGCCLNQGQQCFTKWERKCTYANMPSCQTQTKEFCDTKALKTCRFTKKPEYTDIPTRKCTPIMERTCFNYTAKECVPNNPIHKVTFNWTNEEIVVEREELVKKCHNVRTCKVIEKTEPRTKNVPKQECKEIPYTTQECKSIPVPQDPIQEEYVTYEWRTEYRQQCYAIPKPVCHLEPCSYEVRTQNICPTCISPGVPSSNCGAECNIGVGSNCDDGFCGGGMAVGNNICGACREQNVQMCTKMTERCEMTTEQICRRTPHRGRYPVTRYRLRYPPPKYEMKCEPVTTTRRQCKTIFVPETYEIPVKKCQDGTENKCYEYKVPVQKVVSKPNGESVDFPTTNCTIKDVQKTTCHNLPTKINCLNSSVRRGVLIRQQVCDRQRMAKYCNILPFSFCKNNPGQDCQMVPRQVCQPTCEKSSYCDQCTQFASIGGFSQCSTQTCPNFYSPAANCLPGGQCY